MTPLKTGQAKLKAHNRSLAEIAKPNKFIGRSSNPHSSLDGQYLTDFWQSKNKNYMVQNSCNNFRKKENSNTKMATNYRTNSLAAETKWTTSTWTKPTPEVGEIERKFWPKEPD